MKKKEKRIAVILLNFNGEKLLQKFLPYIIRFNDFKISSIYLISGRNISGKEVGFLNDSTNSPGFFVAMQPQIARIEIETASNIMFFDGLFFCIFKM